MDEFLKKLVETKLLDESTIDSVKKALEEKAAEVEAVTEARVRKELAEQYARDKKLILKALDKMVDDRLSEELAEFSQDRRHLRKMTAKAAKAIAEADKRASSKFKAKAAVLEAMINDNLKKEIKEFHEDRTLQRKAAVKALRESKATAERDRQAFIARGAHVLQTLVENNLRDFIKEFKQDIVEARKNDFGRKIMEAFGVEYRNTFFNENAEARKLAKRLSESEKKISKLSKAYKSKTRMLSETLNREKSERKKLVEGKQRSKIMGDLLSRINGDARVEMKALLESVDTDKLELTFKRYLPTVVNSTKEKPIGRKSLKETAMVMKTGRRGNAENQQLDESEDLDQDLSRLRKLIGTRL